MFRRSFVAARESWEYTPSAGHRSLVLMLYRNLMKDMLKFQSVRRKSLTAYARLCFRKRGRATEKLLIDECIEEARRAIYILSKHNQMATTKEYKFDDMFLPKDTGQDVKTYMEEVYDPIMSKSSFQDVQDVQGGKEPAYSKALKSGRSPEDRKAMEKQFADECKSQEECNVRPPPPPMGVQRQQ